MIDYFWDKTPSPNMPPTTDKNVAQLCLKSLILSGILEMENTIPEALRDIYDCKKILRHSNCSFGTALSNFVPAFGRAMSVTIHQLVCSKVTGYFCCEELDQTLQIQ